MSRFARVYEDPDYEDDLSWDDDEAEWEDVMGDLMFVAPSLAPTQPKEEPLSPFSTINS